MRKSPGFLILTLFLAVTGRGVSLELKEGLMKLVLHESTGRFSLYYLKDVKAGTYVPLFVDSDPRTTVTTVVVDNRSLRLGEAAGYLLQTEKTAEGARFVWSSPALVITQSFSFLIAQNSNLANGLKVSLQLKNTGEKDVTAGAKVLLDTNLGEGSRTHFSTPLMDKITSETLVSPSTEESYWLSWSGTPADPVGLQLPLSGDGVSRPQEVVFANWKRLNETSWRYSLSPGRTFNLLPYSINDSAACMYYEEQLLRSGETREIVMILGTKGAGTYQVTSGQSSGLGVLLQQAAAVANEQPGQDDGLRNDLVTLGNLITKINDLLDNNRPLTQADVDLLRQVLEELKKKRPQYQRE